MTKIFIATILFLSTYAINAQSPQTLSSGDWVKIADDKLKEGDLSGALFGYEVAVKMDSLNSEAYRKWGSLQAHTGVFEGNQQQFDEAMQKFETAARLNPKRANNYYEWGNALLKKGRHEKNLKLYKNEILEKFSLAESLSDQVGAYCIASLYSLLNDKKNSLKWLDITLSKDYTTKDSRINLHLLEHDPNLSNIRDDNKFNKLIKTYFPVSE